MGVGEPMRLRPRHAAPFKNNVANIRPLRVLKTPPQ